MVAIEIRVPQLGESVTDATVAKWLKHPGEAVTLDEPVVELETDKVNVEVPAPASGVLAEIVVAEGAQVPVGGILGILGDGLAEGPPLGRPRVRAPLSVTSASRSARGPEFAPTRLCARRPPPAKRCWRAPDRRSANWWRRAGSIWRGSLRPVPAAG